MRENEGVAARILLDFDADAEKIRNELVRMLSGPGRVAAAAEAAEGSPLAPQLQLEIEKVRARKEEAIDAGLFERAAALREHERRMASAARKGDLRTFWRESRRLPVAPSPLDRPVDAGRASMTRFSVAAVGFPLGLLVGWLIWG